MKDFGAAGGMDLFVLLEEPRVHRDGYELALNSEYRSTWRTLGQAIRNSISRLR